MDGKSTNASSGASNKRKPVPTKQGKKEIGTKTNVDIADDLERFAGEDGKVVTVNYGMAEFIHNTVKEAEADSGNAAGSGKGGASKLGPTGKMDTGMLVIALRNDQVATISVKEEKDKDKSAKETDKEREDK